MRSQALAEIVKLVSESDYTFTLSNMAYLQQLFSSKKQEVLLLTQTEYECLKKLMEDADKSTLRAEIRKKYTNWFSQQCFVQGLITTDFYQQCAKKMVLKAVFFDLAADHYAVGYQFKFTSNKVSYLIDGSRKEIDADTFLRHYNESAKSSGLAPKEVITDLFQLNHSTEITCFKKTIAVAVEKAELIQAKWYLPSNQKKVSSALVYDKSEQKFFIQKDSANIPLKPSDFLNDFKKQYRKERPWYGNVAEWFGFGTLGKLKKQSTDIAKIEYLLHHAKESYEGTTARTLESFFHTTDFVEGFKKQYRKERPWYGFLTEKTGTGTLGKLNEQQKSAARFLHDHGKAKTDSTTAKTLDSLKQFAVYGGGAVDKSFSEKESSSNALTTHTEIPSVSSDRQTPISSDRLSVEAMIKMRDFPLQCADLEKKEEATREIVISSLSVEFEKGFESIDEQEKVARIQKQKQIARRNLLRGLESGLKLFWLGIDLDERNLNAHQKKYIVVHDVGVTKIQCHLYFNEHEIATLVTDEADDNSLKTYRWIQSVKVLYELFSVIRDFLENLIFSDEEINDRVNDLMRTVNRLVETEFLDKHTFKNLSRACTLYQLNPECVNTVSAVPAMKM